MLLALLSDTHDNVVTTQAAIDLLKPHRPDAWLHAGDLVDADMLTHFAGINDFHYVFGNNEYDRPAIRSLALALDLRCHDDFADLTFAGKRLGLLHGHDGTLLQELVHSGNFAYLIHGHTHVRADHRLGGTRIINPGALHRARVKSVALLDVGKDELRFMELSLS